MLDSVKYVIEPYYMMALVKNSRAVTRPYTKNLGMRHVFEHVRKVAEVAYIIANNTGKDTYGVNALMYSTMRGPTVGRRMGSLAIICVADYILP
ncbi:MAG: hypothetical protein F4Y18_06525 [Cenarchaeum sp. SB0663_bin_5]|nr:hypothetical protein [Cenarchaeum sp. SB0663_bin_5]MYH04552.1 hypothetical protein [Cenarchaeum sp. SB0675_bin_21]